MHESPPEKLTNAATVQLISGIVNVFITATLVSVGVGVFCGICTFWAGGLGGMCGAIGCLTIPVGLLEIVSGAFGLARPQQAGTLMRVTSVVGIAAGLIGALPALVAGVLVFQWLREPEVVAYLDV